MALCNVTLSSDQLDALYYPYPTPRNIDRIKKALLVFNHIYFIIPANEQGYHDIGIERSGFSNDDEFTELHHALYDPDEDIFIIESPAEIANEYREELVQAFKEDLVDEQFILEGRNQSDWLLSPKKWTWGFRKYILRSRN